MYIKRTLEAVFQHESGIFPVMLVTGPRQVGKTTFLKHICKDNRTYVSLDDPAVLLLAQTDPKAFLDRFPPPVLIDEIQYAPELLPFIKMIVDKAQQGGMFWLTGSQQFQMMKGVTESLAGRVGIVNLLGFSNAELKKRKSEPFLPTLEFSADELNVNVVDFYHDIWKGYFPKIALIDDSHWETYYASYVQTYLERDVRALAHVANLQHFYKFLRAAAARTGQLLNYSDLSRDADISITAAQNYLSILEASSLVYLLEPYSNNLNKRITKTPKLYFLDTGLAAYLTGWSSHQVLESGAMAGAFFETWCIAELLKSYWHNGKRAEFFFYRDKDQREIDLIIEKDGVLYPVEFKKSSNPGRDSIKHFKVLEQFKKPVGPGAVISMSSWHMPITEQAVTIPAAML